MTDQQLSGFTFALGKSLEAREGQPPLEINSEFTAGTLPLSADSEKPMPVVSCSYHVGRDEVETTLASIAGVSPRECVNDVGQSLPGLATELVRAQSSQTEQLKQREQSLESIKNQLRRVTEQQALIQRELYSTTKLICLRQDETAQLDGRCDELTKEISLLISKHQRLQSTLVDIQKDRESDLSTYKDYRTKMAGHRLAAEHVEQCLPVQKELEHLQQKIVLLKTNRTQYMSDEGLLVLNGERQQQLTKEIGKVEETKTSLLRSNQQMEKQIFLMHQQVEQGNKGAEVRRKRRTAQLTRLRHQLQEAQARRKQWCEEREQLRAAIASLKRKIEE